jgi:hypothetical protein
MKSSRFVFAFGGRSLALAFLTLLPPRFCTASAAVLFESGTLGLTGVTFQDIGNTVPGTNVNPFVFTGVRFELTTPVVTTQIGGHFAGNGTFFGALGKLDGEMDFPNSGDFSTSDFVDAALLTFSNPSAEIVDDLATSLDSGWYALVFGSGLFGATGSGAALRNGMDIENPSYIAYQPMSGVTWVEITPAFNDHRFVLYGTAVPEPSSLLGLMLPAYFVARVSVRCGRR